MTLKSTWDRLLRKFNKPSSDARRIEVPEANVDALLSLWDKHKVQGSIKNALELDKYAFQICPAMTEWGGDADWNLHVGNGKLWIVEDV